MPKSAVPECDDIPSEDSHGISVPASRISQRTPLLGSEMSSECSRLSVSSALQSTSTAQASSATFRALAAQMRTFQEQPGMPTRHIVWGKEEVSSDKSSSGSAQRGPRSRIKNRKFYPDKVTYADHSSSEELSLSASGQTKTLRAQSAPPAGPVAPGNSSCGATAVAAPNSEQAQQPPSIEEVISRQAGAPEISDAMLEAVISKIPVGEDGMLTSVGSMKHAEGKCKPCAFFRERIGCSKGAKCAFCHIPHRGKSLPRPGKSKRTRYKDLISRQSAEMDQQGES